MDGAQLRAMPEADQQSKRPEGRRLLFLSLLPFVPESRGGADLTHLCLFRSLERRGWRVRVLCGTMLNSSYGRRLCREWASATAAWRRAPAFVADDDSGFPAWRGIPSGWSPWAFAYGESLALAAKLGLRPGGSQRGRGLRANACRQGLQGMRAKLDELLDSFRPDLLLGHYGVIPLLDHAALRGFPCFYYSHGTQMRTRKIPPTVHAIVNSPAAMPEDDRGVRLLPPMIDPADYRVVRDDPRFVTFVNPVREKGADIAIETARRLPHVPFLFVEGGWARRGKASDMRRWVAHARRLPNVTVWKFQSDVRAVYRVTDVLLMPSRHESFGRVVIEAHHSGIPVVAARVGGIPFAMGQGGLLVDPSEGVAGYVRALEQLEREPGLKQNLARLAQENSRRPEFDPETQVEEFLRFVVPRLAGKRARENGKDARA